MSDTPALLVVDVQQSFLHAPYWREDDVPAFRENHNAFTDTGLQAWLHDRGVDRVIGLGAGHT
jgi:nicotinamidase-related amidase